VWDKLPTSWDDGAFIGNGVVGAIAYGDQHSPLRLVVNRTDLYDRRTRLPVGAFAWVPGSAVRGGSARVSLWDAELLTTIATKDEAQELRAYTHAVLPLIVVDVTRGMTDVTTRGRWDWQPDVCAPPRALFKKEGYEPYPPAERLPLDGGGLHVQPLKDGGAFAVGWTQAMSCLEIHRKRPGRFCGGWRSSVPSLPAT